MGCLLGRSIQLVVAITAALLLLLLLVDHAAAKQQLAKPGCPDKCGKISIPYPFGVGSNCSSFDHIFNLTCNGTTNELILGKNIEVLNISLDGQIRVAQYIAYDCYDGSRFHLEPWLHLGKFTVSSRDNKFVAIGCDTRANMRGFRYGTRYWLGCMTYCDSAKVGANATCSGVGCCQTSIPDGVTNITIRVSSFYNHTSPSGFNPCSTAAVVANDAFIFSDANFSVTPEEYDKSSFKLPIVLNWTIGNLTCESAAKTGASYLCQKNSECYDPPHEMGYRCRCSDGYEGNPYLLPGCQDIDECKDPNKNECEKPEYCVNHFGQRPTCQCPHGYHGNGTKSDPCTAAKSPTWIIPMIGSTTGTGIVIVLLMAGGFSLYLLHRKKKLMHLRESLFQQNGGILLKQKLPPARKFTFYTTEELEKATDNYNESNKIGRGAFGLVYKGTLPNGQCIAIKKFLKIDSSQIDQFVNEINVLSEINNRNVVRLLGCCLETKVPLLVYEYITNGTLFEHLHEEEKASLLTWDIRLRIATEVAGVLSYLHNTLSTKIIHRDVKSENILLDDNYTAKVSDFGCSKLVPEDQEQLATMVVGTLGYLDPEYIQTSEFTEKSDVYSFGVVLVELLTRKKVVSYRRPEAERFLAMIFILKFKEDRLFEILDDKITSATNFMQLKEVANLAMRCLRVKGEERPIMKEVQLELEGIMRTERGPSLITATLPLEHQKETDDSLVGIVEDSGGCSNNSNTNIDEGRRTHLELYLEGGR